MAHPIFEQGSSQLLDERATAAPPANMPNKSNKSLIFWSGQWISTSIIKYTETLRLYKQTISALRLLIKTCKHKTVNSKLNLIFKLYYGYLKWVFSRIYSWLYLYIIVFMFLIPYTITHNLFYVLLYNILLFPLPVS